MKKIPCSIFTIIFLSLAMISSGQTMKDSNSFLSVYAGLNMGKRTGIENYTTNTYLPFLGLDLGKYFTKRIVLAGGIGYSVKGSNSDSSGSTKTYRFHYLYAEGFIKYNLTDYLNLSIGLQPSYLIKAKHKLTDSSINGLNKFSEFELNIPVGLELTLQKQFSIGFSYDIPNPLCSYKNFKLTVNVLLNPDKTFSKTNNRKTIAYSQIKKLKAEALFVRLQSDQKKTEALIKKGNNSEAENVKNKAKKRNIEIIKAFRTDFNFCQVYFFFDNKSEQILTNNLKGTFINDSLTADSSIVPSSVNFFIAEFGTLESSANETIDNSGTTQGNSYSGGSYTGISALRILDSQFIQLEEPFPFYVRIYEGTAKRTYSQMVTLLNKRLMKFYEKAVYYTSKSKPGK